MVVGPEPSRRPAEDVSGSETFPQVFPMVSLLRCSRDQILGSLRERLLFSAPLDLTEKGML